MCYGFMSSFLEICEKRGIELDLTYITFKNVCAGLGALFAFQKKHYEHYSNVDIVAKTLASYLMKYNDSAESVANIRGWYCYTPTLRIADDEQMDNAELHEQLITIVIPMCHHGQSSWFCNEMKYRRF